MLLPARSAQLRHRISWLTLLSFYLILMLITWVVYLGKFSDNVDQLLHDVWVRAHQRAVPEDVVIVSIDSSSLASLGRWPWPRLLQTALFNKLAKAGVRAVAVDLLYVEPDADPAADAGLGQAIGRIPIVVLPVLTEGPGLASEYNEKLPISSVAQHVTALGHIYIPLDSDGVVRRVNLKSGIRSAHWSTLGLALAEAVGDMAQGVSLPGKRLAPPTAQNRWVEDYQVLIPFYGPSGSFANIPAVDVISETIPEGALKDKIVFLGSTATGLGDVLPTPVSGTSRPMPGVEIHANIFSMLREGSSAVWLDNRVNFLVAALLLALLLFFYSTLSPLWALVCLGATLLLPIILSFALYRFASIWYAPLTACIPILISYFVWSWHRLEFVAEFLRRETDLISRDMMAPRSNDNALLVSFFDNALNHLPLDGWVFTASGEEYSGGQLPKRIALEGKGDDWTNIGDFWRKRYRTKGRLDIAIRARDFRFALEFTEYIDSLSRVKERQHLPLLSAPLERVQSHTYELKRQLDRFRQLKALSDTIFEGSPAGLIVWSAAGEVVGVNALAAQMFPELTIAQLSLREFIQAIGRDPENLDREVVDELVLHKVPWQINRLEHDTELVLNFNAVGEALIDRLISASIVDVTEIRRSERSRAEMIEFLSHDLRAPLISSLYQLKFEEPIEQQLLANRIESIESNINHSLTMIDDLLNIARADNISSDQFSQVLFELIVGNATNQMSPIARARNIRLDITALEEDLWIACDASLMERALINVLSNAIKYSPEHTTVKIETGRQGDDLVFQVSDQGVGIAPEMMANLFQRFKRDKQILQQYKGIGLGLALVAKVINEHGGSVRAESPGHGTVIVITLPLIEVDGEIADSVPAKSA